MQKNDTPGLEGLNTIGSADKWRKELVGTPTYLAAALLGLTYAGDSLIGSLFIVISIAAAYHYIYAYTFRRFKSGGQSPKLLLMFGWQVIFWASAFILWFVVRPHVTA